MKKNRPLPLLIAAAAILSCTDGGSVGPRTSGDGVAVVPSFATVLGTVDFLPIQRIRVTAKDATSGEVLHVVLIDVDPEAAQWTLDVSLPAALLERSIVIEVEALHIAGDGSESVQFSGRSPPFQPGTDVARLPQVTVPMGAGPISNQSVTSVTIGSHAATIGEGETVALSATAQGGPADVAIFWSSLDPTIASVGSDGLVTGLTVGTARIVALAGQAADTTTVTVTSTPSSITVEPADTSVTGTGVDVTFRATVFDTGGNEIVGLPVAWTVADPAVATHLGGGIVRTAGAGTTDVIASLSDAPSVTGTASLEVIVLVPVASVLISPTSLSLTEGGSGQLQATTLGPDGSVLTDRAVFWTSANPAVASVDPAGFVTAVAEGTTTITATSEGQSATAQVTVARAAVGSVQLSPSGATMAVGDTLTFLARAFAADGSELLGRQATWTSSDPVVASVTSSGLVTAIEFGTTTVTASVEGVSASANVSVEATILPVDSVKVTPDSAKVFVGGSVQYAATLFAADGSQLANRATTWAVADGSVASVDASGVVTGVGVGVTTVTATSEGISGSAVVDVQAVPVASVTVSPDTLDLEVGASGTLTATARDSAGTVLNGRPVTWTSADASVATVDALGGVAAVGAGLTTVTATVEGIPGTAVVRVTPAAVDSVAVTPVSASVLIGGTVQLAAQPFDSAGNALTGRTVAWTTSDATVATVDGAGLVTGVAAGAATITATSEGVAGTSSITVGAVPVDSVDVTPTSATILAGGTVQLAAQPLDSAGNALGGRVVTWTTADASVATVDSVGLVTGVAPGSTTITASSEGKIGVASITVNPVPVDTVDVSPDSANITVGGTVQLTATPEDSAGNALTGRTVTWASTNTGIATVDASGLVTGVALGTTTVTATSEGKIGVSTITVSAVPVAAVVVTPATPSVVQGGTVQLTADPQDSGGGSLSGRTVTWASQSTGVATVDAAGLVTGVAPGTAQIDATSEGVTGSATVTVTAPAGTPIACGGFNTAGISAAGEVDRYHFTGNTGETILFGLSGAFARLTLRTPSGGVPLVTGGNTTVSATLAESGTFQVDVEAADGSSTGSYGLSFACLTPASGTDGTLTLGQTASGSVTAPGDLLHYTFTASAGDKIAVGLVGIGSGGRAEIFSGGTLVGTSIPNTLTQFTLPNGGTQSVVVRSSNMNGTGATSLSVVGIAPYGGTEGALNPGDLVTASLSGDAQLDAYSFNGNAGDLIALLVGGLSGVQLQLFSPSGLLLGIGPNGGTLPRTLSETGVHTVVVHTGNLTGTTSYKLAAQGLAPANPVDGTLSLGQSQAGTILDGDMQLYTFSATAGDIVYVTADGLTNTNTVLVSGGVVGAVNGCCLRETFTIPTSGTQGIWVYPLSAGSAQFGFSIAGVNPPSGDGAIAHGTPTSGSIDAIGDADTYSFSGTAGDVIIYGASTMRTELIGPSGTIVHAAPAGFVDDFTLTETGTHVLSVHATNMTSTGSYDAIVQGVSPAGPSEGTVTLGSSVTGSLAAGDLHVYTFTAAANDKIYLTTDGSTPTEILYYSGGVLSGSVTQGAPRASLNVPTGGTQTLVVRSSGLSAQSYGFSLHGVNPVGTGGTIALGTPATGSISAIGEADTYSFTGNAGDVFLFGSTTMRTEILAPSGAFVHAMNPGGVDNVTLTESGTHVLSVHAVNMINTGSYEVILQGVGPAGPAEAALALGDNATGTLATGDVHVYTFSANAGDQFYLTTDGSTATDVLYYSGGVLSGSASQGSPRASISVPSSGQQVLAVRSAGLLSSNYGISIHGINPPGGDGAITLGTPVSGSISAIGDADTYFFSGSIGDAFAFGSPDMRLEVIAPSGTILTAENPTAQNHFTLAENGTHVLIVHPTDMTSTGSYQAVLEGLSPVGPNEGAIALGGNLTGTVSAGDLHLYTFTANAGDVVYLTTDGSTPTQALLYSGGTLVGGVSSGSGLQRGAFTVPNAGPHVILVKGPALQGGNYGISIQGITPFVGDGALTLGQTVSGSIDAIGDVDTWSFVGNAGDVFRYGATNFGVELRSPSGNLGGSQNQNGFAIYTLAETGTHTIVVRENQTTGTGSYSLNAMSISPAGPSQGALTLATPVSAATTQVMEGHAYTFTAAASGTITLEITRTSGPSSAASASLYDPSGSSLGSVQANTGQPAQSTSIAVTAGTTYTVLVHGFTQAVGYTVEVR